MAAPFIIQQVLVVKGGWGRDNAWCANVEVVSGHTFAVIKHNDRLLARLLGCDMSTSMPFKNFGRVFAELTELRNDRVDCGLAAHARGTDPFADASDFKPHVGLMARKRQKTYHEAMGRHIPEVIDITHFGYPDHGVPEITMKVMPTSRRQNPLQFELTEANMEWLILAVHAPTTAGASTSHGYMRRMFPDLPHAGIVKWRSRKGVDTVFIKYVNGGDLHTRQETPAVFSSDVMNEESLKDACDRLYKFYTEACEPRVPSVPNAVQYSEDYAYIYIH